MQNFIITLLICSVTMSVLALLYMAVTPLLAKRYSVTGRYYAWLIVVIGLIISGARQYYMVPPIKSVGNSTYGKSSKMWSGQKERDTAAVSGIWLHIIYASRYKCGAIWDKTKPRRDSIIMFST